MKQEDAMQFQLMSNELEQVQDFLQRIENQMQEVNTLLLHLEEFKNAEPESEILFPLANGIFAQGKITNTKKLHINVGQDVIVERTVEEAQALVDEQKKNLQEQEIAAVKRQEELYTALSELEKKVREEN